MTKVRKILPILAIVWMAWIFATSSTWIPSKSFVRTVVNSSGGHLSKGSFDRFWHQWWWLFVKGYHVTEYAILTTLLIQGLKARKRSYLISGTGAFLYACSDEFHQTFVPGRGGTATDVSIDSIGIGIAIAVAGALRHFRR